MSAFKAINIMCSQAQSSKNLSSNFVFFETTQGYHFTTIENLFSQKPTQIIVCGGGAKNKNLLEILQKKLNDIKILTANDVGFNIDSIEAEAFAFLAIRRILNLPISFKKTTGTLNLSGSIGGVIYESL